MGYLSLYFLPHTVSEFLQIVAVRNTTEQKAVSAWFCCREQLLSAPTDVLQPKHDKMFAQRNKATTPFVVSCVSVQIISVGNRAGLIDDAFNLARWVVTFQGQVEFGL